MISVLAILILIGMVKEGLADYKRHKTDKLSNAQPAHLITGKFLDKNDSTSKELKIEGIDDADEATKKQLDRVAQMNRLETKTVETE